MINIELPEISAEFTIDNITINREKLENPGIYFLRNRSKSLLYVGQAKNLYARLTSHRSGRGSSALFYEDIAYIEVIYLDSVYEREIYETHAIYSLQPPYNRAKTEGHWRTEDEIRALDRVVELRDERRLLVAEILELRQAFDRAVYYEISDLTPEELTDWGTLLHNEKRVREIDAEIIELKRVR